MSEWSKEQVLDWLGKSDLSEYIVVFEQHQLVGIDLLDMCNDDLLSIGVAILHERKRILRAIKQLIETRR